MAYGNNPTLFDHTTDEQPAPLTPAQAARFLLALHAYGMAGLSGLGKNFTDGPLARFASVMPLGLN